MTAPYDLPELSKIAESQSEALVKTDNYAESSWTHPTMGPLLHVYALLTHRPQDALGENPSPERIAECRVYAYVFLSAVHNKLSGHDPEPFNDGFVDLMTEYDPLTTVDFVTIHDTAIEDAVAYADQIPPKDRNKSLTQNGSVRRIK
ncbi:hypothetical protein [Gimesia aquarii]|uniref:Uncharacterized protein n=1 Tax=Gimesia aquarii TaxID=2527964 RepID=A0A517X0N5_9PLAN|nr:hypothetical protein [Gimesia aquarii]QDU11061.1 hypothetical protein V202x_44770 [Gimesia aquarii]